MHRFSGLDGETLEKGNKFRDFDLTEKSCVLNNNMFIAARVFVLVNTTGKGRKVEANAEDLGEQQVIFAMPRQASRSIKFRTLYSAEF